MGNETKLINRVIPAKLKFFSENFCVIYIPDSAHLVFRWRFRRFDGLVGSVAECILEIGGLFSK